MNADKLVVLNTRQLDMLVDIALDDLAYTESLSRMNPHVRWFEYHASDVADLIDALRARRSNT